MQGRKITTVKVLSETRSDLIRIKGQLESERGRTVNADEVIQELIRFWRSQHP